MLLSYLTATVSSAVDSCKRAAEAVHGLYVSSTNALSYAFQVLFATKKVDSRLLGIEGVPNLVVAGTSANVNFSLFFMVFAQAVFRKKNDVEPSPEAPLPAASSSCGSKGVLASLSLTFKTSIAVNLVGTLLAAWYGFASVLSDSWYGDLLVLLPVYGVLIAYIKYTVFEADIQLARLLNIFRGKEKIKPGALILTCILSLFGSATEAAMSFWFTEVALTRLFKYFLDDSLANYFIVPLALFVAFEDFLANLITSTAKIYYDLSDYKKKWTGRKVSLPRVLLFLPILALVAWEVLSTEVGYTLSWLTLFERLRLIKKVEQVSWFVKSAAAFFAISGTLNYFSFYLLEKALLLPFPKIKEDQLLAKVQEPIAVRVDSSDYQEGDVYQAEPYEKIEEVSRKSNERSNLAQFWLDYLKYYCCFSRKNKYKFARDKLPEFYNVVPGQEPVVLPHPKQSCCCGFFSRDKEYEPVPDTNDMIYNEQSAAAIDESSPVDLDSISVQVDGAYQIESSGDLTDTLSELSDQPQPKQSWSDYLKSCCCGLFSRHKGYESVSGEDSRIYSV
jgi:hypothetical protein